MLESNLLSLKFENPGLIIRYAGSSYYFDLGEGKFKGRDVGRAKAVFFSHFHLDHAFGLERLLGMRVGLDDSLVLSGPKNAYNQLMGRLQSYTWNLLTVPLNFQIQELDLSKKIINYSIPGGSRNEREEFTDVVMQSDDYQIKYRVLDHGTPSIAYKFTKKGGINISNKKLQESGFSEGKWIRYFKDAYHNNESHFNDGEREKKVEDYTFLLEKSSDISIVYATDFGYTKNNLEIISDFASGADDFYCESNYLNKDVDLAKKTHHLTAAQVGNIANEANVKRLHLFHHSSRYENEEEFIEEAAKNFSGEIK